MGIRSYIRDRIQVRASRAGNGAAAASEFVPPRPHPRPGAGAPRPAGPKPKRETGGPPSSTPPPRTEKPPYKKPDYKENEYLTMKEKSALPSVYDELPAYAQPTQWPEGDGDRRSPIDRI